MTKQAHRASSEAGRKVNRRFSKTVGLIAAALVATLLCGQAATAPAEAKEEMERGLAAVRSQAWEVAIQHFEGARKHVPDDPTIMFNLGLAHGRAGHDLLAATWLRAYLARTPQAANAGAVRKEILDREVAVEATVESLLQRVEQIDGKSDTDVILFMLTNAHLELGNLSTARNTLARVINPYYRAQVHLKLAEQNERAGQRTTALSEVNDALNESDKIDIAREKAWIIGLIAIHQYRSGYRGEAYSNMEKAYSAAMRIPRPKKGEIFDNRSVRLSEISVHYVEMGQLDQARKVAQQIDPSHQQYVLEVIAKGKPPMDDRFSRHKCELDGKASWQEWAAVGVKLK